LFTACFLADGAPHGTARRLALREAAFHASLDAARSSTETAATAEPSPAEADCRNHTTYATETTETARRGTVEHRRRRNATVKSSPTWETSAWEASAEASAEASTEARSISRRAKSQAGAAEAESEAIVAASVEAAVTAVAMDAATGDANRSAEPTVRADAAADGHTKRFCLRREKYPHQGCGEDEKSSSPSKSGEVRNVATQCQFLLIRMEWPVGLQSVISDRSLTRRPSRQSPRSCSYPLVRPVLSAVPNARHAFQLDLPPSLTDG
jgi:hypothetical protein